MAPGVAPAVGSDPHDVNIETLSVKSEFHHVVDIVEKSLIKNEKNTLNDSEVQRNLQFTSVSVDFANDGAVNGIGGNKNDLSECCISVKEIKALFENINNGNGEIKEKVSGLAVKRNKQNGLGENGDVKNPEDLVNSIINASDNTIVSTELKVNVFNATNEFKTIEDALILITDESIGTIESIESKVNGSDVNNDEKSSQDVVILTNDASVGIIESVIKTNGYDVTDFVKTPEDADIATKDAFDINNESAKPKTNDREINGSIQTPNDATEPLKDVSDNKIDSNIKTTGKDVNNDVKPAEEAVVALNEATVNTIEYEEAPSACPFVYIPLEKTKKKVIRPKVLKQLESNHYLYDRLYGEDCPRSPNICNERVCLGSIMGLPGRGEVPRNAEEVLNDAKDFFSQYFASIRRANTPAHEARWRAVQEEVAKVGTYQLTTTELVFGAKLAWRNASRCIGRIQWSKLQVFDCRQVTTTSGMFEALCNHIKYSTNKGNIRSAITVFPQRTDGKHDYRIWNSQLISYAGYRQPDGTVVGDPMHCEFTELCIKLGWKPQRTAWDILPLVLSANGKDPDYFEIPRDLVMEIHMTHPNYEWFEELGLRWYALPAVSSMRFDCGGIEFTANAFNGWYMSTEIGCRNFCDNNRLNMLEKVAQAMGLDTRTPVTLWKDKALVEVNVAVLHSFQQQNATIVDHHTASDSFIKHLDNENRLRTGCPADWVWIVPPMSSSITPVFHQEMALYFLKPSYEYQEPAWKTHQWQKSKPITGKRPINRKFHFKQIARAVKFTSKLFGRALSKRIKATVLFATETGKSEQYAKELGVIFGHAFNAQVHCMSDYDITSIEHEALLLVVTSTFGNGDPPENGVTFGEQLCEILYDDQVGEEKPGNSQLLTPKSFIKANGQLEMQRYTSNPKQLNRLGSLKGSTADTASIDSFGPLSNVRFAVFALGSSAYPNFCNFGKYVDKLLVDLGGERIHEIATGDEMRGQDQAFRKWASSVFNVACETFCLDDDETLQEAKRALGTVTLSEETVRFARSNDKSPSIPQAIQKVLNKNLVTCVVKANKDLGDASAERSTIFIDMEPKDKISYEPGDHVGIIACNRKELVDGILARLKDVDNFDEPLQLHLMKETHTSSGPVKSWEPHERLPSVSVRDLLTRFLDITTPPTTILLQYLAKTCENEDERKQLNLLATEPSAYEDWRHYNFPTLLEVLDQFPSARPSASLLAALLSPLQPRFYSISSSPVAHPKRLHLTVAIVTYKTQDGDGPVHYGVCSNYLMDRKPGDEVYLFIRSAPNFHLPDDTSVPLILIGPGTGIAPFRGFWHHRRAIVPSRHRSSAGQVWLFFGCRTRTMDLYREEKEQALKDGVLSKVFLALSREKTVPKMYVQEVAEQEGAEIHDLLVNKGAHFYVCGDCKMAEDVNQKLRGIIKKHGNMTDENVQSFMFMLKEENRYHEDIFGITLRTAEVHNASRETARRNRVAAQP